MIDDPEHQFFAHWTVTDSSPAANSRLCLRLVIPGLKFFNLGRFIRTCEASLSLSATRWLTQAPIQTQSRRLENPYGSPRPIPKPKPTRPANFDQSAANEKHTTYSAPRSAKSNTAAHRGDPLTRSNPPSELQSRTRSVRLDPGELRSSRLRARLTLMSQNGLSSSQGRGIND